MRATHTIVVAFAMLAGFQGCSSDPGADRDGGLDWDGGVDASIDAPENTLADPDWPPDLGIPPAFDFPPYLNLLDPTTVVVSWRSIAATTGKVRFGTTEAYGSELASATSANLHHVSLAALAPASAYHYEVSIDGTTAARKGVFVTPGRASWRFLHSGEYHAPSESSNVVKFAASIRAFRPHVIVESGDMVDDGNNITHWRSYLRSASPWIGNVLLLPAQSNHVNGTGGNTNFKDLFVVPNNERWYTTRLGQVEVFTLDSTYSANSDVMSAEVPWLAQQAAAAHDGVDDPTFVIAAWHHPACSSQYYTRSSERSWVQTNFVDTLRTAGGVDLIFAAHDKYYERSTITGGIVHVITNIGNVSPEIPGNNHAACTAVKTDRSVQSVAFVTVTGSTLSARVLTETGAELDTFTITK